MTPNELLELAIRKLPLGHPIVSMVLAESGFWSGVSSDDSDVDISALELPGALLDELPDVPARTGDCAELLAN